MRFANGKSKQFKSSSADHQTNPYGIKKVKKAEETRSKLTREGFGSRFHSGWLSDGTRAPLQTGQSFNCISRIAKLQPRFL